MKVVIFDVDNTLIKGHLTRIYLKVLLYSNPFLIGYFFSLIIVGGSLLLWHLPRLLKKTLRSHDFVALDRGLQRYATLVVKMVYAIFDDLGWRGDILHTKMNSLACSINFESYVHVRALRMIEMYLKKKDTRVVLASAGIEETMLPFYAWLCAYLQERGVNVQGRLRMVATQRDKKTGSVEICLGDQKIKRIEELLRNDQMGVPLLTSVYTDNQFLADLPLLLNVQGKGYVIGFPSALYQCLPVGVVSRLCFYPSWMPSV